MPDDPDEPSLFDAPALASHASSSAFEIWPSLSVSMADKLDEEPEDDPPVEVSPLNDPDEVEVVLGVDAAVSIGGGGGGGAFAFMKDASSDCDTEPSPSSSIAARSFEASLAAEAPSLVVGEEEPLVEDAVPPPSTVESSDCETLPSPFVSSATNACDDGVPEFTSDEDLDEERPLPVSPA